MNLLEQSPVKLRRDVDRCDRCGAMGAVVATKGDYTLIFCNHHLNEHSVSLIADAWLLTEGEYE